MKVKIKKLHKDAVIPKYAKIGDAGLDMAAVSHEYENATGCHVYKTGLAIEIPENHVGLLFPRSSLSKYEMVLTNHVGVIDSGYRGEICFKFKEFYGEQDLDSNTINLYNVGDRVGQLLIIPYPQIEFEEVEELSKTERGAGGYGSSGK